MHQAKAPADELVAEKLKLDAEELAMKKAVLEAEQAMRAKAATIGNLVGKEVPVSMTEVRDNL
jgi:seryl-tRNA synthetase